MAKKNKKRDDFRSRAKRRAAGFARRLGEGETVTVRFLFEMDDEENGWGFLLSQFDSEKQRTIFYEDEDDTPEGAAGVRESYFATAYDCDDKERDVPIDVWELRKTLVVKLIEFEDEYGSVTDRDYKLRRRGTGVDTTYAATPLDAVPMSKKIAKARKIADGLLESKLDQLLSASDG